MINPKPNVDNLRERNRLGIAAAGFDNQANRIAILYVQQSLFDQPAVHHGVKPAIVHCVVDVAVDVVVVPACLDCCPMLIAGARVQGFPAHRHSAACMTRWVIERRMSASFGLGLALGRLATAMIMPGWQVPDCGLRRGLIFFSRSPDNRLAVFLPPVLSAVRMAMRRCAVKHGGEAMTQDAASSESEFRRGWPVVTASLIGIGLGLSPLPFYTMGVFAPHLAKEFGWNTAQIMAGLSITTLSVIVAGPAAGILAERYGTRRVVLISIVLFALAFCSMAMLGNSLLQFYLTWGVIAFVGAGTLPITFTRAVSGWFDRRRGIALGFAMSGTGLFGILCKPYLAWVIGEWGWRAGYLAIGLLPLLIALPIALLAFRDPPAFTADQGKDAAPLSGLTRGEALRSWRFWLIAVAMLVISFCLGGPVPNLEGILRDRGFEAATILSLSPLIGLAAIAGRILGGLLLDWFWAPAVAFVMLGLPAIACWLLAGGGYDVAMAALAIMMIGFALGIEYDVVAYLTSRYFGMRAYAGLYAIIYVCFAVGSGVAPLAFGLIRDATQGYGLALMLSAIALPLASALFLLLGRYPKFGTASA